MADMLDRKAAGSSNTVPQKSMVMMSIEKFPVGLSVPFDVCRKEGSAYSCVLKKWQKFDPALKADLKSKGVLFLYVEGEPAKVTEYFEKKPAESKPSEAAFASYAKAKDEFHNVSRLIFTVGSQVNFSVYRVANLRYEPLIETIPEKPVPVTDTVCNADGDLAIKVPDLKLYREYLLSQAKKSSSDKCNQDNDCQRKRQDERPGGFGRSRQRAECRQCGRFGS